MAKDKYTRIFLRQMEVIVSIFLQLFLQRAGKVFMNNSPFSTWSVHLSVFAGTTV